jgi:hypothetical protein
MNNIELLLEKYLGEGGETVGQATAGAQQSIEKYRKQIKDAQSTLLKLAKKTGLTTDEMRTKDKAALRIRELRKKIESLGNG